MEPAQASARQSPGAEVKPDSPVGLGATSNREVDGRRDALRVQAAAVAAQQEALLHQELCLGREQTAWMRQQEQLASHLQEQRQSALELSNQVQAARAALRHERETHSRAAANELQQIAKAKAEAARVTAKSQADRRQLRLLRRRLLKHLQRRVASERNQIRNREAAVGDQHRLIEKEAEKLQAERQALQAYRLEAAGEWELKKRQIEAEWLALQRAKAKWEDEQQGHRVDIAGRLNNLRQREDAVARVERELAEDKVQWESKRRVASQELAGLESRIVHQRANLAANAGNATGTALTRAVPLNPAPLVHQQPPLAALHEAACEIAQLTDELTDQRLQIVEAWERLALTEHEWQQSREQVANELECLGEALEQKEQAIQVKQATLDAVELEIHRQRAELASVRQQLHGWAAKLKLREGQADADRDGLLMELDSQKAIAGKHLKTVVQMKAVWGKRRRRELELLRAERDACQKLREECVALQQGCWKRSLSLEQQHRELSERTLALEEYRQRVVLSSQDAAGVDTRLERFRQRWVERNASVMRGNEEQIKRLEAESAAVSSRGRELLAAAESLCKREQRLAQQQAAWEEANSLVKAENAKLQTRLENAECQRQQSQRSIAQLHSEVERLAQLLLDAGDAPSVRAA